MDRPKAPFGTREERIAFNEAWRRDLNKYKTRWMKSGLPTTGPGGFRCECGRTDCDSRFPLSETEWKEIRSQPDRFAVAPGHVAADVEVVIKEYPHFWLVEKRGEAEDIAEKLD
jgi:hypothetical protein